MNGSNGTADDGHLGRQVANVEVEKDRHAHVAEHVERCLTAIQAHDGFLDMQGASKEKGLSVMEPPGIL